MYKIEIECIGKCFDVKVGCRNYLYATKEAVIADLSAYLTDPESIEEAYSYIRHSKEQLKSMPEVEIRMDAPLNPTPIIRRNHD